MNVWRSVRYRLLTKPNRAPWVARLFRALTPLVEPEKWVFIVGCYNSGTTLLERMLALHPDISALDEGVFVTGQLTTAAELGWPRMWSQVVDQVRLEAADRSVDVEELKRDWAVFLNRRKPIFLEKSIVNSARLLWLQENFRNSHFIFIVRNGYAVAEGIRRKAGGGRWSLPVEFGSSYSIELCARQWVVSNQIVERDSNHIQNIVRIHYEELCDAPRQVVQELWRFLGLRAVRDWPRDREWAIQGKRSAIRNMNELSFSALSLEDIDRIESVAAGILQHYGYPLISRSSGDLKSLTVRNR